MISTALPETRDASARKSKKGLQIRMVKVRKHLVPGKVGSHVLQESNSLLLSAKEGVVKIRPEIDPIGPNFVVRNIALLVQDQVLVDQPWEVDPARNGEHTQARHSAIVFDQL